MPIKSDCLQIFFKRSVFQMLLGSRAAQSNILVISPLPMQLCQQGMSCILQGIVSPRGSIEVHESLFLESMRIHVPLMQCSHSFLNVMSFECEFEKKNDHFFAFPEYG